MENEKYQIQFSIGREGNDYFVLGQKKLEAHNL